jgi:hypothetical protein
MNIIYQLCETWNLYWLSRKAKKSAQLSFQQLTEFYDYYTSTTRQLSANGQTPGDSEGNQRDSRLATESNFEHEHGTN